MTERSFKMQASFTVEAAMLMCVILPVLLALLYLGMFLHDKGVLNGAAQEVAATADLNRFRNGGNARLARKADQLADRTGASGKAKSSVQVTDHEVSASTASETVWKRNTGYRGGCHEDPAGCCRYDTKDTRPGVRECHAGRRVTKDRAAGRKMRDGRKTGERSGAHVSCVRY